MTRGNMKLIMIDYPAETPPGESPIQGSENPEEKAADSAEVESGVEVMDTEPVLVP